MGSWVCWGIAHKVQTLRDTIGRRPGLSRLDLARVNLAHNSPRRYIQQCKDEDQDDHDPSPHPSWLDVFRDVQTADDVHAPC